MTDCIFCSIIEGKTPAQVVYQDDQVIVIENISKIAQDQNLLIIPKNHVVNYLQCDPSIFLKVQQVALLLKQKLNLSHLHLMTNYNAPYQTVFHAHFHLRSGPLDFSSYRSH